MRILWGLFRAEESEEERKRRQNAALDRKIAGKELEIRMLRGLLRERKEKRFNRRMERRRAVIREVSIDGVIRTSDKYDSISFSSRQTYLCILSLFQIINEYCC